MLITIKDVRSKRSIGSDRSVIFYALIRINMPPAHLSPILNFQHHRIIHIYNEKARKKNEFSVFFFGKCEKSNYSHIYETI